MSVLPVGIGAELGGYQIERSLRFNSPDSAYLNRTPASTGNRKTWTWSGWIKRGDFSRNQWLFAAGNNGLTGWGRTYFKFNPDETFGFWNQTGAVRTTLAVFRDPSAWYHFVVACDTTQAVDANRVMVYVNGVQQTLTVNTAITQNQDTAVNINQTHQIGVALASTGVYFNGYMTEINHIDGQSLTPSSFGETNPVTGVWQPIEYTGTYGTNGFYLNFSDNSGTTSTTLGKDSSGNGNNWTPNNFSVTAGAGNDSLVDSPTRYGTDTGAGGEVRGNYAVLNPLGASSSLGASSLSNGNLTISETSATNFGIVPSTIFVSSGKWYWEVVATSVQPNNYMLYATDSRFNNVFGIRANGTLLACTGTGFTYTSNDILGVALDVDAKTFVAYKNGVSQGTFSITSTFDEVSPAISESTTASGTTAASFNFGQRPFAYTAPSGFKALVTTNLPTPTIGATSTTLANKYFDATTYTGNGATPRAITNSGSMQPDLVWIKARGSSTLSDHVLDDAVRGATLDLFSNLTVAEQANNSVLSFNSNGFSVGDSTRVNQNTIAYVGWQWNAGGSNATNTSGTITSTVRANTTAGFSIVTYTGNNSSGSTVGHGLGVAPSMVIIKSRSNTYKWIVYHASLTATNGLVLNTTAAQAVNTGGRVGAVTSTTIQLTGASTNDDINALNATYVAYCFAPVAGYSAFGSYTGNGSADGPFVFTNFRPRYVLTKRTDSTSDWYVHDTARSPTNVMGNLLYPNGSGAEFNTGTRLIDCVSNGFKIRRSDADINASGGTFIFMAFAENPFAYSLAR